MVLAERLGRSFGKLVALSDVELEVPAEAIVGLLGPNGAGKTTLMRILTGQLRPSTGRAVVAGHDVVRERWQLRREIGVLFDVQNLYSRLTVQENLNLHAAIFGVPDGRIAEVLEEFELTDRRSARVSTLSHGMRQKVLLARAFLNRPRVLFLDEPTTGLDPNWTKVVQEVILRLRDLGTTVLLATHQMQTADILCDAVAIIDQGKMIDFDAPRSLKRRYGTRRLELEAASDGRTYRRSFSIDSATAADEIAAAIRDGTLVSLRTDEATLDDVFRELTGKSLVHAE